MSDSLGSGPRPAPRTPQTRQTPQEPEVPRRAALRRRLAELRGPAAVPHPLDARALAALAANPGCRRRALLDGAGVDKTGLASALGAPSGFGQSQFAFMRGHAFEARVKADGGAELLRLLGAEAPDGVRTPDLAAAGPEGRAARTALALREATAAGGWTLLDHPLLALEVAGSPAYLEPDAVVVRPDGRWTVVEVKSFPVIDGSADAAKVGAAARQAAVYVLALERIAAVTDGAEVDHTVLLVCPRDFSNQPTGSPVDVRRQLSVTRRQLARLTRLEDIAAEVPRGMTFDVAACSAEQLAAAVDAVPHAYAPECLAACELAFHCRDRARTAGAVEALGRSVRGELGGLTTVGAVLAAARGEAGDPGDPAVAALRRAAALRAEAVAGTGAEPRGGAGVPGQAAGADARTGAGAA
ncbi:hypothetical protein LUW75_16320 [Streptomyces sp. MRC013]|uniref:hypothetical protein n=1 Tax=Streptomyces sp. MRC013 TaxID=2898276 RepID=UPI002025BCF5|nr:hypothetical protein [Streptomyces sp. MRC013]URM91284.1 hypothetical protein LUW75_16320 [Streptomyces sp. MRC013]